MPQESLALIGGSARAIKCRVPRSMSMSMVQIRVVRMSVSEGRVEVAMGMRFRAIPRESVLMPVMVIVDVRMNVFLRLVRVLVRVSLG